MEGRESEKRTYKPAPARTLETCGGGVELLLEVVDGTEGLNDGLLEGTVVQDTAVSFALCRRGSKVLPEKRVIDVTYANEGEYSQ